MKHICDLLLCLVLSASVWAGDVLPWGQGNSQMISSVPEEFASVLWWRAGGFAAAVQYLEMDWPGDDGREQRVSVTSLSEIQDELARAIEAGEQPPAFDLSRRGFPSPSKIFTIAYFPIIHGTNMLMISMQRLARMACCAARSPICHTAQGTTLMGFAVWK